MSIPDIISQRKQFVADTYAFYSQHTMLLDEMKNSIIEQMELDLEEEAKLWQKWQKKLLILNHFNHEIQEWMKAQKNKEVTQKRIIEISYLKSSFETQADAVKKHYLIYLNSLDKKKRKWKEEIALYFVRTINQNSQHKSTRLQIESNLHILKDYSEQWNASLIDKLRNLLQDTTQILDFCEETGDALEKSSATSAFEQSFAQTSLAQHCSALSNQLHAFGASHDFEHLSAELKIEYESLKVPFVNMLQDSSMTGLKTSIKLVNAQTQEKLIIIQQKMKNIEKTFSPHFNFLVERRNKMIGLCVNAQKLEEHTAYRWIEANLSDLFFPFDAKLLAAKDI